MGLQRAASVAYPLTPAARNQPRERRRFPRVQAPVLYRHAGAGSVYDRRRPHDVSLGGLRIDSSEFVAPGSWLDVELLLPDQWLVICSAEVAWSSDLPESAGSVYAVGLKFVDLADADRRRLLEVLARHMH